MPFSLFSFSPFPGPMDVESGANVCFELQMVQCFRDDDPGCGWWC